MKIMGGVKLWPSWRFWRELLGQFSLLNQQDGDTVADRVHAPAARAFERLLISGEGERLAALRHRADQNVEELLEHHEKYCTCGGTVRGLAEERTVLQESDFCSGAGLYFYFSAYPGSPGNLPLILSTFRSGRKFLPSTNVIPPGISTTY